MQDQSTVGMSATQAKAIEYSIVALSIVSLVLLFQPFSLALYSIGAGLVVLAGLAFNLVPLCTPGRPLSSLIKAALIIALILFIVAALSMGSVELYAMYLTAR
ncbi:MAG TPA: hypothetical protein VMB83_03860 [Roseiarcus sp.]|nr:hypothetical protein [Roseiarcus sp.]